MMGARRGLLLVPAMLIGWAATGTAVADTKSDAVAAVERQEEDLIRLSDQIWRYAETALREVRSAALLADHAEQQGFRVTRGVAGMPTAFLAEYGSGRPIIGILGEYDALPGLSQKAEPRKAPLEAGAAGHGCGHNLFGAASLGAAIAVKEQIEAGAIDGTIRFYGTPAEESVGGKLYMVRAGLFEDVDVILAWHPDHETKADATSSQAMVDFVVEFRGKASHAAFDPWNGRSAVDGLEIFTYAINMMREHLRPSVRVHYAIVQGGDVPNVVPEYAKLWCWVRDSKRTGVDEVMERVRAIADGAALAAGVEAKLTVQSGDYEMLVNMTGARLLHDNLTALGPLRFSDEEQDFARRIQEATGVEQKGLLEEIRPLPEKPGEPEGGSTDVADVSWVVPTLHLTVTTTPAGAPWHAWPVVASGGMSIGHRGMIYAARVLAGTMIDLYRGAAVRAAIRAEFERQTSGHVYKGYLPPGPPPVPGP